MSGSRGYSTYHGRSPFWKGLVIALLLLVILAASAFLFLQNYLVYDDNGQARLELPWQKEAETVPPSDGEPLPQEDPTAGDDLIIQEPENALPDTARTVLLTGEKAQWQTTVAGLSAAGSNGFAVIMKERGGVVNYASQLAPAEAMKRVTAQEDALLQALLESESHSTALLSCFWDEVYSAANVDSAALKNTGNLIFWDGNNSRWLDPAKPAARKYLCGIAAECAAMGFDEIVLTDFTYPTLGKLSKIAYGKDVVKEAQLLLVLEEMRAALEPYDVLLSVELPAALFETGADEKAGLQLSALAQEVDAIYVETTEAAYDRLQAKLPEGVRLVVEQRTDPATETASILRLPDQLN